VYSIQFYFIKNDVSRLPTAGWKITKRCDQSLTSSALAKLTCNVNRIATLNVSNKVVRSTRLYVKRRKKRRAETTTIVWALTQVVKDKSSRTRERTCKRWQRLSAYTHGLFSFYLGTYYLDIFTITAINVFVRYVYARKFTALLGYLSALSFLILRRWSTTS